MAKAKTAQYVPGMYAKRRVNAAAMADQCLKDWERKKETKKRTKADQEIIENARYISFSRKIGAGALEIADMVSEKTGYRVVDREIIEHMAERCSLQPGTLDSFDERYPGMVGEFGRLLFGEKSFTHGDYMRLLCHAIFQIASTGPTIFVGRATHLILPREKVLAVRLIISREQRVKRVADILNTSLKDAEKRLDAEDKLQKDFFKKNFNKKEASPYEFDLIINRDHLSDTANAAELVCQAYTMKFGAPKK